MVCPDCQFAKRCTQRPEELWQSIESGELGLAFELPELGYACNALEPYIDERTMEIHHTKHHAACTANLNAALEGYPDLQGMSVESLLADLGSLPEGIRTAVRNNGGGYANHNLFWTVCAPGGNHSDYSSEALRKALHSSFGSYLNCKEEFSAAAASRFGSGWAWLEAAGDGSLSITFTPNQDSPLVEGRIPIFGLDLWEHACYLKYQNRRADYIDAFFYVINWTEVTRRYEAATS